MLIRHFEDLGFSAAVMEVKDFAVEYAVFESCVQPDNSVFYSGASGKTESYSVEAVPEFTGQVKWDGCSDWKFDSYLHGCGRDNLLAVGQVMAECWDWTAELLPNFDGE